MALTRVGIASIPTRKDNLKRTIMSIIRQVDSVVVALNDYNEVPGFCNNPKITAMLLDNSLGDGAKFLGLEGYNGYFFALDDDLVVKHNYVRYLRDKISHYRGVVSLLGKKYDNRPIWSARRAYTEVYRALGTIKKDVYVDVIGSGACGFHTRDFRPDVTKWERRNMADIWVSRDAHLQGVPLIAVAHKNDYLRYTLGKKAWRIWTCDRDDKYQAEILNTFLK